MAALARECREQPRWVQRFFFKLHPKKKGHNAAWGTHRYAVLPPPVTGIPKCREAGVCGGVLAWWGRSPTATKKAIDPDKNRTCNLLIWSQLRYHCATEPVVISPTILIYIICTHEFSQRKTPRPSLLLLLLSLSSRGGATPLLRGAAVELNEFQIQQELRLESGFLACG